MANNPEQLKEMGKNAREYVRKNFNRDNIAADFLAVLKQ